MGQPNYILNNSECTDCDEAEIYFQIVNGIFNVTLIASGDILPTNNYMSNFKEKALSDKWSDEDVYTLYPSQYFTLALTRNKLACKMSNYADT